MYVWQVEELNRRIHTRILAATLAAAMGAEVEIPDEAAARAEFDEYLRMPPAGDGDDPAQRLLLQGLGLRP